jgi:protein O-mannosyl-transferase
MAVCAILMLATLAVYAQTFRHGYVSYDDDQYFYENPMVRAGLSAKSMAWAFTTFYFANWHPLTWLSYLVDYQWFGLNAGAQHAVNVAFHFGTAILLYLTLQRMTGCSWRSAVVAGIFTLHPLHVESVAWISERKDVLCAFFEMLSLLLYARYVKVRGWWKWWNYAAMILAFTLSLLAKPMAVTFPFVLLLLDYWPLRRLESGSGLRSLGSLIFEKSPLFAMSAITSWLTFLAQRKGGAVESIANIPFAMRGANAAVGYVRYIGKAFWPADLAVLYPFERPFAIVVLGAALIVVGITVIATRQVGRRPYLLVGWLWFLGMLVPVIGLVQVGLQSIADRYTYVPLIGLSIAVVWAVAEVLPSSARTVTAAVAILVLFAFGAAAFVQAGYWKDSETLYTHTLAVTAGNSTIQNNLGAVFQHQGRIAEAADYFRQAIASDPGNAAEAHYNLGLILASEGNRRQAIEEYRQALAIRRDYVDAHVNLGHELLATGQLDEAVAELRHTLQLKADSATGHADLGMAFAKRDDFSGAVPHLQEALRLEPANAEWGNNLCFALERLNRLDEAITACTAALKLRPDFLNTRVLLGKALAAKGQTAEANSEFLRVLTTDPNHAGARAAKAALEHRK